MNFEQYDLLHSLAKERQHELMAEAAERRLVRLAKRSHPSGRRFGRVFRHDPAS